jgi:hypothetical protein
MRGFCLDANGCLCMLDRVDGMVISVGVNIRAGERHHHPSVVEVAGFGIADERCGEWCVTGEASVTEKQLVALCLVHFGTSRAVPGW